MKKYPDIESWYFDQEAWQQKKFNQVRKLILFNVPEVVETIKYGGVPFYTCKGDLFYFTFHKKQYFVLGFCGGFLMNDESGVLQSDAGQKHIKHWILHKDKPVDEELLVQYIHEAVLINNHLLEHRKAKRKK